jgi:multidrug efflux pump subunit AcrA (membrane-fusion protein)
MPLVALVAVGGWFILRPEADPPAATTATTGQLVAATTGDMAQTVSAEGTVAAAQTDDLSFSSSGTVTAVNVAAGDPVKAGDVLATIDSAELADALTDAEATVADAEAALSDDTDAGASDAQLEADQSTLDAANDKLDAANEALAGAQLVATFDGTVAVVNVTVGEELASGGTGGTSTTGSGSGSGQSSSDLGSAASAVPGQGSGTSTDESTATSHVQIVSTDSYTVELNFDDTDVENLAVGQEATVALSTSTSSSSGGFPGGGFPGGGIAGARVPDNSTDDAADDAADDSGDDDSDDDSGDDDSGDDGTDAAAAAPTTSGSSVTGLVTEVGKVADASSGVASYPVTITFTDTTGDFNPGATASVDVTYAQKADVVQVSTRAVTTADGTSTVEVDADGKAGGKTETRTVTTGLTSGTMTEITSGLKAGEQVVLAFPGRGASGSGGGPPAGFDPSQLPGAGTEAGS